MTKDAEHNGRTNPAIVRRLNELDSDGITERDVSVVEVEGSTLGATLRLAAVWADTLQYRVTVDTANLRETPDGKWLLTLAYERIPGNDAPRNA